MRKLKWGVLSTALIGTEKVIPGMQRGELCDILAICSRDLQKAQSAAADLGIPRAYGSYQELLDNPEVEDLNPLPNHLHVPWSIKALQAGKHVLCEKPIAPTAAEAQQLLEAAGNTRPQSHGGFHVPLPPPVGLRPPAGPDRRNRRTCAPSRLFSPTTTTIRITSAT